MINVGVSAKIQKNIMCAKKLQLEPRTCICENSRFLKSIVDNSGIINAADSVAANVTNTVPADIMKTV